jgi:hypothetical protein
MKNLRPTLHKHAEGWQTRCIEECTALIQNVWIELPEECRDVIADIYRRDPRHIRAGQAAVVVEYFSGMETRR